MSIHKKSTLSGMFNITPFLCFICVFVGIASVQAQPMKRMYLANDDHTDYMWTGNEAQYDSVFVRMLDYYLNQIDSTQGNPDDFQARFNCDGSYWLRTYQKFRSPAQFERLIGRIRTGHISSPLNSLVSVYGGQPTEAVLRGMYYAGQLERQWSSGGEPLRFRMAVCMENQTLPLGLSSLWAGSGAKYSWRGVCGCASKISHESLAHRRHQLYRYMGQDGRSVIMKWYNRPIYNGRTLGGYAEARREKNPTDLVGDMGKVINDMTMMCDTTSAISTYPFNVAGAFGYGWDDLATYVSPPFITAAKRYSTTGRRVRVSNEEDFFADVERSYPKLPTESVSYGNEWDLYPVSMNEITARVRRATERLRSAEGLATLVALKDSTFARNLDAARRAAWDAYGLYWEHDWTADGPVSQKDRAEWQIRLQKQITSYADSLLSQSVRALGGQLNRTATTDRSPTTDRTTRFFVFNPLSWERDDVANLAYDGTSPVRVVDVTTGREVASQIVRNDGKQWLRVWAEKVPSVGYKVYAIGPRSVQPGPPSTRPLAATVAGGYISNPFCRLRLHPSGVISELYDRPTGGRQLVKPTAGRYLNDLGTTRIDEGQPLTLENVGPVSVTVKAVSPNPLPHTVRVTLYRNSSRIEIQDSILANFADVKSWAFSFNLDRPTTRHEELGAILTVKKETRGGHYASQNARYDYQTFNHFADLSEPTGYGVTLSNLDCSFFKLGSGTATTAPPDSLWEQSAQLNALAGGQNDPYSGLSTSKDTVMMGIYRQFGQKEFLYQFALTTHRNAFDPVTAMKFALEHQNPLVAGSVTGSQPIYSAPSFSLLSINNPNLLLWSLKPSEEGINNGVIARFWNLSTKPLTPTLSLSLPLKQAWQTTHIETNEQVMKPVGNQLKTSFSPRQINTYRLGF